MITVMLVDDEPIEREGLRLMLSKNRSNFEIVAEAKNGQEAVEQAVEHQPDLIFMDIKMPEFDGIEAIRRILPDLPHTKYIMVSAFDTFEYAREAMKFGIKEYLLKPSAISELLEAFDRMVEEIEMDRQDILEKEQIQHRLERVSAFVETEFIVSFMMDHIHEFNDEEWEEWLDLEDKQGFVSVFSFESDKRNPDRSRKGQWHQTLKKVLQEQQYVSLVGPLTGFQVPVLTLLNSKEKLDDQSRGHFARTIIHRVQHLLTDCRIVTGVGNVALDVDHFSRSYKEAIDALELVYHHPSASYMLYREQSNEKRGQLVPFELERELVSAVKKGDSQKSFQLFETYFQSIQQANDFQVRTIHKAMEDFFIVLTRSIKELGFNEEIKTSLGQFDSTTQIKEVSKTHLLQIIERIEKWRSNGVQALLLQAKDYMDKYFYQSISLEEVAEQIGISSYYLSKLFKDTFHVTFIDYLTSTRLEKAKELLLDQQLPLKEIALNIGYKDPNYFSRVFKKEIGISPSEYRLKNQ
ncbi:response regulator [Aquibacillus salsiterrae]|uniref:Response regulator n=1 Tax=Aquibacillus salsiterrae TaxID=2950439 RepID=A0A9X4AHJ6_9BACI|nr:response regulator [Aquibacillus salsiterrae]MDC3418405.1 response regulator [Aquibacillus salsiterrae]